MRRLFKKTLIWGSYICLGLIVILCIIVCVMFFLAHVHSKSTGNSYSINRFCYNLLERREYTKKIDKLGGEYRVSLQGNFMADQLHYLYSNTVGNFYVYNKRICKANFQNAIKKIRATHAKGLITKKAADKRTQVCDIAYSQLTDALNHWKTDVLEDRWAYYRLLLVYTEHNTNKNVKLYYELSEELYQHINSLNNAEQTASDAGTNNEKIYWDTLVDFDEDKFITCHLPPTNSQP